MAEQPTQYRVGDFIEYIYTGFYLPEPVLLREEILEQHGNRLTIDVQAVRGEASKHWIQVVTDTDENQKSDRVDQLYEWVNGQLQHLTNEANRDAHRLYEWIMPPQGQALSQPVHVDTFVDIPPGLRVRAQCTRAQQQIGQRLVEVEYCSSAEFLWTNLSATFLDLRTRETLYAMRIHQWGSTANEQTGAPMP